MNRWVRKMVNIFKSAVIGGVNQYLKDEDAYATADAKRRAALDKEESAKRLARYKSDLKREEDKLKKSSIDYAESRYAYPDMSRENRELLAKFKFERFVSNEDEWKNIISKTPVGQAKIKAEWYNNKFVPSIIAKINSGTVPNAEKMAANLLASFNGYVGVAGYNQKRISEDGSEIKGSRMADSFESMYELANMFPHLPESKKYLDSFGEKIIHDPALLQNPAIAALTKKTRNNTRLTSSMEAFPKTEFVYDGSVPPPDPNEGKTYSNVSGFLPPSILNDHVSQLVNYIQKITPQDLHYSRVKKGSDAEKVLGDRIIKRVRDGELGSTYMEKGNAKNLESLNFLGSIVGLGYGSYTPNIVKREGPYTTFTRSPNEVRAKEQTKNIGENARLVNNVERLLEINTRITDTFPNLNQIQFTRDIITRGKNLFKALTSSDKEKEFGSTFTDDYIKENLQNQGTDNNEDLRSFVSNARDSLANKLVGLSGDDYNMVKEYNMLKIRLIFGIAKSIQGGTGGRGVSNADFEAVAKSMGDGNWSTLAEEKTAFSALLRLSQKQYLFSYFARNKDVVNTSNIHRLVSKTMDLHDKYREGIVPPDETEYSRQERRANDATANVTIQKAFE